MREMERHPQIESILVHTGQHYDKEMSDIFFDDLDLPRPDIDLGVGSGSHAEQTAEVMVRFEPVVLSEEPDLVLVVGDVNSTLACSLVAAKLHVPIAHVEAGVRSFDRTMPEEVNRVVTDVLSSLHFTPSRDAGENLLREGIPQGKIHFVGNVMMDTLLSAADLVAGRQTWRRWGLRAGEYGLLTLHRPSNVDDRDTLAGLVDTLARLAERIPIVFPLHPRTASSLAKYGLDERTHAIPSLVLIEPQGYLDFCCLLSQAKLVLTDSGGIQTETSMLGIPCLTLRRNTEWPVTIEQGTNRLVGTDRQGILAGADKILRDGGEQSFRPELWDGHTAPRIVRAIADAFDIPALTIGSTLGTSPAQLSRPASRNPG
jgi:UDP-N-acetylglucosamine 2-epimerase (non-hydrolysing)